MKKFFLLLALLLIVLLSFYHVSDRLVIDNQFKDVKKNYVEIQASITNVKNQDFQVSIILSSDNITDWGESFVSVYNQETLFPIYSYSKLRTNSQHEVDFTLSEGRYILIFSSNPNVNSTFYYFTHVIDTTEPKTSVTKKDLSTLYIELNNFPKVDFKNSKRNTPFKIELTKQIAPSKYLQDHMTADVESTTKIFLENGLYNINLDPLSFSFPNPISYAYYANVDIPKTNKVIFNFDKKNMTTTKFTKGVVGWYKFNTNFFGDVQGVAIDVEAKTHHNVHRNKLSYARTYIPSQECVRDLERFNKLKYKWPNFFDAINFCTNTDISFNYVGDQFKPAEKNTLFAPNELILLPEKKLIKQGEKLNVSYFLNNDQQQKIIGASIHQSWDTQLRPLLSFYNQKGERISSNSHVNEFLYKNTISKKICIKPGDYLVKGVFPKTPWTKKVLKSEFNLTVQNGEGCLSNDLSSNAAEYNYSQWQDFDEESKVNFFEQTDQFLDTLISVNPVNIQNKDEFSESQMIDSCVSLFKINNNKRYTIVLSENILLNAHNQAEFSKCLKRFSKDHPNSTFILENAYFNRKAFPSSKRFMYYHFYRIIKEGDNQAVGIAPATFDELFYGFPDFFIVGNKFEFFYGTPANTKSILSNWFTEYDDLIKTEKIYYID